MCIQGMGEGIIRGKGERCHAGKRREEGVIRVQTGPDSHLTVEAKLQKFSRDVSERLCVCVFVFFYYPHLNLSTA